MRILIGHNQLRKSNNLEQTNQNLGHFYPYVWQLKTKIGKNQHILTLPSPIMITVPRSLHLLSHSTCLEKIFFLAKSGLLSPKNCSYMIKRVIVTLNKVPESNVKVIVDICIKSLPKASGQHLNRKSNQMLLDLECSDFKPSFWDQGHVFVNILLDNKNGGLDELPVNWA